MLCFLELTRPLRTILATCHSHEKENSTANNYLISTELPVGGPNLVESVKKTGTTAGKQLHVFAMHHEALLTSM